MAGNVQDNPRIAKAALMILNLKGSQQLVMRKREATKEKKINWTSSKLKSIFASKHTVRSEKTKPQNVRTYHIYNKGLKPRIKK